VFPPRRASPSVTLLRYREGPLHTGTGGSRCPAQPQSRPTACPLPAPQPPYSLLRPCPPAQPHGRPTACPIPVPRPSLTACSVPVPWLPHISPCCLQPPAPSTGAPQAAGPHTPVLPHAQSLHGQQPKSCHPPLRSQPGATPDPSRGSGGVRCSAWWAGTPQPPLAAPSTEPASRRRSWLYALTKDRFSCNKIKLKRTEVALKSLAVGRTPASLLRRGTQRSAAKHQVV